MSPRLIAILVAIVLVIVGGMVLSVKRSSGESKAQRDLDAAASRNPPPAKSP
ncbi:MAG TPA: hypothetical protein VM122_04465 [Usitatibacter sp.]|nr:hypothetical protein [Usitatibacter sp.]